MVYVCVKRFDVMKNLKNFTKIFKELNKATPSVVSPLSRAQQVRPNASRAALWIFHKKHERAVVRRGGS